MEVCGITTESPLRCWDLRNGDYLRFLLNHGNFSEGLGVEDPDILSLVFAVSAVRAKVELVLLDSVTALSFQEDIRGTM